MADVWAKLADVFHPPIDGDERGVTGVTGVTEAFERRENGQSYDGYAGYAVETTYTEGQDVDVARTQLSPQGDCGLGHEQEFAERTALIEYGANVPREWAEGLARLDLANPIEGYSESNWRRIIDDGGRFLDRWGAEASRLGWSAVDVFGVHPIAPYARLDAAGLVILIKGGKVVSVLPDRATISVKGTGSLLTYTRRPSTDGVALWELIS